MFSFGVFHSIPIHPHPFSSLRTTFWLPKKHKIGGGSSQIQGNATKFFPTLSIELIVLTVSKKNKLYSSLNPKQLLTTTTLSPPKNLPPTTPKHYYLSFIFVVVSMGVILIQLVIAYVVISSGCGTSTTILQVGD